MYIYRSRAACALIATLLCWFMASLASAQTPGSRLATANSYLERGAQWFAKRELEKAIAEFDLGIASAPDFGKAYYNRATARVLKGALDEALLDFDRAIQLNPRHVEAYLNRSQVRYRKGDLD